MQANMPQHVCCHKSNTKTPNRHTWQQHDKTRSDRPLTCDRSHQGVLMGHRRDALDPHKLLRAIQVGVRGRVSHGDALFQTGTETTGSTTTHERA